MATTFDSHVRPEIRHVLGSLKSRIRWYILADGLMLLLFLVSVLFWFGLLLNRAWFDLSYFELPAWVRIGYDLVAVSLITFGLVYWIGLRLFRSITTKPLALVLERRFPYLNDRLITSVEVVNSITGRETELTRSMLNRTIDNASQEARRLRVSDVFETRPLLFSGIASLVGVLSMAAAVIFLPAHVNAFLKAYVGHEAEYWPRETKLVAQVLVDDANRWRNRGGSQIRNFDDKRRYRHPRGMPLTLLVHVPETNEDGDEFVVPERVEIVYRHREEGEEYEFETVECNVDRQRGERYFKRTFNNLPHSIEFFVQGNDYRSRKPYYIDLVEPPRIEQTQLECEYPPYSGLNSDPAVPNLVDVHGTEVTLPAETRFLLRMSTNNPIRYARLEYGDQQGDYMLEFGYSNAPLNGIPAGQNSPPGPGGTNNNTTLNNDTNETAGNDAESSDNTNGNSLRRLEGLFTWTGLSTIQKIRMRCAVGIGGTVGLASSSTVQQKKFSRRIPASAVRGLLHHEEGNPGLRIPFILSAQDSPNAIDRFFQNYRDFDDLFPGLGKPFLMPPSSEIRIFLEDIDGIHGSDPGTLVIHATPDKPPVIEAEPRDIGNSITRTATVPIFAKIADDYGLSLIRIDYRVAPEPRKSTTDRDPWQFTDETVFRPRDPLTGRFPKEYRFRTTHLVSNPDGDEVEKTFPYKYFNVPDIQVFDPAANDGAGELRDLKSGDRLALRIYAEDSDNLNGPNTRTSVQVFDFKIVTESELLDILYNKESNARVRFEAILKEIEETKDSLMLRKDDLIEWRRLMNEQPEPGEEEQHKKQLEEIEKRVRDHSTIAQARFRKNHNETQDIEAQFRQIRAELINNHLRNKDAANVTRIDKYILHNLNEANKDDGHFERIDKALDQFIELSRREAFEPDDLDEAIGQSVQRIDELLVRLKAALKEMKELVKFHKAVQDLEAIIKDQELLLKLTRALMLRTFGMEE